MKKLVVPVVLVLLMISALPSCFHFSDHDVSISVSDDDDEYEMDADYSKSKSHAVRVYLDDHLLNNGVHFSNTRYLDEEVTLDDNTTFYIRSKPGRLRISIDKTENSEASCNKVRQACEDLKIILADH